jgi:predicted ArsR family transcriptional regulator
MTLAMIIMICVGCALIVAGLAAVGYRAVKLAGAARKAGVSSMDQVHEVMRRGQAIVPRVEQLMAKQKVVAERLQSLSATTNKLGYLADQLDQATGRLSKLKS